MAYPKHLSRPVAAVLATCGLWALAPGAWAQTTSTEAINGPRVDAAEGFNTTDTSGGIGGTSSPYDLIHRAVLMNGTTMEDFNRQQRGHLSNEAANFRALQQQALQQQAQPQAVDTTTPQAE